MSCIPCFWILIDFSGFSKGPLWHMQWSFPVRYVVPKHAAWLGSSAVFDFGLSWVGQDALHHLEIFIWNTALSAAPLGNLYLEYCTFCCTTWKSLSGILHFLLHHLKIFFWNLALSAALLTNHYLKCCSLHCFKKKKSSKKPNMLWRSMEEDVQFTDTIQSLVHCDDTYHTMYEEERKWMN